MKAQVTKKRDMRPLERLGGPQKPKKYESYLTVLELARVVGRDPTRIRKLERNGTIPTAKRVQCGKLSVRLFSPFQVEEIKEIVSTLRPGPRRREGDE